MACSKHPQRKRKDCPDCQADVNVKHQRVVIPKKEEIPQKTSRDMLKEMEKEEEQLVIKKERKKREKVEAPVEEVVPVETEPAIDVIAVNKKVIDEYFDQKLNEFKQKVSALSYNVRWEHLALPAGKCSLAVIGTLEKDGWKYIDMYIQPDIVRISGFKEPVAVFQRAVSDKWKKTADQIKKEYK